MSMNLVDTVEPGGAADVPVPRAATPPPEERARGPRARTSARRDQPSITDRMQKEVDEYTKLPAAVPGKDYRKLHKITHPVLSFLHSV